MDFGLARFHDDRTVPVDGRISGTLVYLGPERWNGWPADCRTDIFSLGIVVEEMAARRAIPEAFRRIGARATARDRSRRFRRVRELAAAPAGSEVHAYETPTILVAEDDDTLRASLEVALASAGYRVVNLRQQMDTKPFVFAERVLWLYGTAKRAATGTPTTQESASSRSS